MTAPARHSREERLGKLLGSRAFGGAEVSAVGQLPPEAADSARKKHLIFIQFPDSFDSARKFSQQDPNSYIYTDIYIYII